MIDEDSVDMNASDELTEFNIEESEFLPVSKVAKTKKKAESQPRNKW